MSLDLDGGLLGLRLSSLGLLRGLRLCLCLNLSLLSFQYPDLGLHQLLLLLWRHPGATLAELVLNSSESLLLRDIHLPPNLRHGLSDPVGELEGSTVNGGGLGQS